MRQHLVLKAGQRQMKSSVFQRVVAAVEFLVESVSDALQPSRHSLFPLLAGCHSVRLRQSRIIKGVLGIFSFGKKGKGSGFI